MSFRKFQRYCCGQRIGDQMYVVPSQRGRHTLISIHDIFHIVSAKTNIPWLTTDTGLREEYVSYLFRFVHRLVSMPLFIDTWVGSWFIGETRHFDRLITEAFEDALNNPMCLFLHRKARHFEIKLQFPYELRAGAKPIDCRVVLEQHERQNEVEALHKVQALTDGRSSKMRVVQIEWNGRMHSPTDDPADRNWLEAQRAALCAVTTRNTIEEHFVNSHVLVVGGLFALGMVSFEASHPIYVLLHVHGYPTPAINTYRGVPLLHESFSEFSFTPKGLAQYIEDVTSRFRILDMLIVERMQRQQWNAQECAASPLLSQATTGYKILSEYVSEWVEVCYRKRLKRQEPLSADIQLADWWTRLRGYSMYDVGDLTRENLVLVLSIYVWTSVSFHELVGDQSSEIYTRSDLFIPSSNSPTLEHQRRASKAFSGRFIFHAATDPATLKLTSVDWTTSLAPDLKFVAKNMQRKIREARLDHLSLGINK